jgi:N-acyl homoserine lactone hydrolase
VTARLYAFTCGHLTMPMSSLLAGTEGLLTIPVPAYLIVHPKGQVLFDTGLNEKVIDDSAGYLGEMASASNAFHFSAHERIASRLTSIGVEPTEIRLVINSHLHLDHAGGNAQLPNAEILVQRRELETAQAHGGHAYVSADFDTGQQFRPIDGEYDVFGDGSVVCIPTFGHTAGHQSLRVRTESTQFVLCADACYLRETLENMHLPDVVHDQDAALRSLTRLQSLQQEGSTLLFGHDPSTWTSVPQAPDRIG